jgi:hypothetical protein
MKIDNSEQWTDINQVRVGTAEPGRNSYGNAANPPNHCPQNTQMNTLTQSRNKEELITKGLAKNGANETSATTLHPGASSIQQQNGTKLRIKKYGEPSKLKMAGAASLQRETNNSSELGLSKKYNNRDADPLEWLTGSLGNKAEIKR